MSDILSTVADLVRQAVTTTFGTDPGPVAVDVSDNPAHGDMCVSMFGLAKALRKAPPALAAQLAPVLAGRGPIAKAEAVAAFVNMTIDRAALFDAAVRPLVTDAAAAGRGSALAGRRLLVEFSAPNTNKPQHLGHLRNNFLGDSVARILANAGADVTRVNLINDRGIHICKSMLAWKHWANGLTPEAAGQKGDHFVGSWYVRFEKEFQSEVDAYVAANEHEFRAYFEAHGKDRKGNPRTEDDVRKEWRATFKEANFGKIPLGAAAQEMLRLWEAGDTATVDLWKMMNAWVFAGFDATYGRLGITFDKVYLESETYLLGRDLILSALERGVFSRRADGAVEIDLSDRGLGKKVVLRSDGTSVYITQDIGTTVRKADEWKVDGQIWVVADEQRHHFANLFAILDRMGYAWAKDCHHLAYGLVNLPEGRMKSREGTVVDADNLMDEVASLAKEEIVRRDPEAAPEEVARRSECIALAALRFMLLKVSPATTMIYNPKESVAFDGETGPYLLYTHARIGRMLRDAGLADASSLATFTPAALSNTSELALARVLLGFRRAGEHAAREYAPSSIAKWLVDVAQAANTWYQDVPILKADDPQVRHARLVLAQAVHEALARGCTLLGITMVGRM